MRYFLFSFFLFFSACSNIEYKQTKSKLIIIKSPQIKFADLGYVRNNGTAIELELFMAGRCIKKIQIDSMICVDEGCMSRSGFNEDYLNASYPDDLFQHIALGLPIYDGKNMVKNESGFVQKIKDDNVDIKYKVNDKQIFFKDKRNNIIFKIKELP